MARQGTDVGIDPHKRTLTATVLDRRGGLIGTRSFRCQERATASSRPGQLRTAGCNAGASKAQAGLGAKRQFSWPAVATMCAT